MKKTYIVIDSTSYAEREYIEKHDIEVVPLSVELGGEASKEGLPGSYDIYYEKLKSSGLFPTTSQPSVGDFQEAYKRLFERGGDRILVLTFSSGLSGTNNSAKLAADMMEGREIRVVDTFTAGGIFRYMLETSVEMLESGSELDEIERELKSIRDSSNIDLTVDTLEYLKRGGRLTNIQAMVAGLLNIKPVISLIDGKLVGNGKCRGKRKALSEIIGRIPENPVNITIHHVQCLEDAEVVKKELESKFKDANIVISELGPVIGSHLGPGGLGICTVCKK